MTPVTFYVGCPRCAGPGHGWDVELVSTADPVGWPERERRVVLQCTRKRCRRTVVIEVRLLEVDDRRSVA